MTMRSFLAGLGAAVLLLLTAWTACAQQSSTPPSYPAAAQPLPSTSQQLMPPSPQSAAGTGIPAGPLTVTPGVIFAQGYDDNLFWQPSNTRSSSFSVLSPFVRLEAKPGPHKFEATVRV